MFLKLVINLYMVIIYAYTISIGSYRFVFFSIGLYLTYSLFLGARLKFLRGMAAAPRSACGRDTNGIILSDLLLDLSVNAKWKFKTQKHLVLEWYNPLCWNLDCLYPSLWHIIRDIFTVIKQGWNTVGEWFCIDLETPFILETLMFVHFGQICFFFPNKNTKWETYFLWLIPDHPHHTICLKWL